MLKSMRSTCLGFVVVCIIVVIIKVVHNIWWRPKSVEKLLRKQGMKGTSYRLFTGDMPEMNKSVKETLSKPIALNAQIVPRVIPFYHKMVHHYGKVSVCWYGTKARVIIGDAEMIRKIFEDKNSEFVHPPLNPLVNLLQLGVSTLEGEEWRKRRKLITPAFHPDKLKGMVGAFSSSCCRMIERWVKLVEPKGSCEVDVAQEFSVMAGDVIARTAFGSSYNEGHKIFELQKQQALLMREAYNSIYIPGFRFVPTRKNKRRYQLDDEIKGILKEMIERKEEAMKRGELGGGGHEDLLGLLLQCKEESKNGLSTEEVIEECKLFYFAGQETTANLLTWTLIYLSMHPNWQQKARHQVLQICGTTTPTLEAIHRLKIVSMILHEVLRLFPPLPAILRYTTRESKVGSLSIPAGVELCLLVMQVHYDTEYWGDDALEFNPERFAHGVSKASNHIAFFPFGWGPRICLGQNFAFIEAKMALAIILQHFSFQLSPSYAHAPSLLVTLKPQHGAPIILHRI
ncbi:cytochrome P450 CYP72A219-like [Senna tora]|uniref:Cytochrome P450 CYP72A219-like n=1 Tax=Senna tora TaxID=362788 RepID=A0A834WSM3_9FABA|nr:cytochrome P450 CYP72A219-like [Senna tora]